MVGKLFYIVFLLYCIILFSTLQNYISLLILNNATLIIVYQQHTTPLKDRLEDLKKKTNKNNSQKSGANLIPLSCIIKNITNVSTLTHCVMCSVMCAFSVVNNFFCKLHLSYRTLFNISPNSKVLTTRIVLLEKGKKYNSGAFPVKCVSFAPLKLLFLPLPGIVTK